MKAKDARKQETSSLQSELTATQRHLYDLRSQAVTEKLEDPSQLAKTRRKIAVIRTVLRQRELESANERQSQASASQG